MARNQADRSVGIGSRRPELSLSVASRAAAPLVIPANVAHVSSPEMNAIKQKPDDRCGPKNRTRISSGLGQCKGGGP